MNKTLLSSLLLGACCAAPIAAVAGGIEVATCCTPPRVDIPDMREGWGFYLEGAAIRPYNNDLGYAFYVSEFDPLDRFDPIGFSIAEVQPDFNFDLRVGVDYTLANSANVLKLNYEHLFSNRTETEEIDAFDNVFAAAVKIKLDAVSLVSEQHILIGPYWEATLTGGLRYARVAENFANGYAGIVGFEDREGREPIAILGARGYETELQFNGVGPLVGLGGMFHLTENLALGAEGQVALLLGRSDMTVQAGEAIEMEDVFFAEFDTLPFDTESRTSIVPEIMTRIYGNYFYRFTDGMELQVELGWRLDQYMNIHGRYVDDVVGTAEMGLFHDVPANLSDDVGFSGPYLSAHLKI